MIFGENPLSRVLLAMLNLKMEDTGRYRDCYISDGKIVIYT
jgi:hypothetical protein